MRLKQKIYIMKRYASYLLLLLFTHTAACAATPMKVYRWSDGRYNCDVICVRNDTLIFLENHSICPMCYEGLSINGKCSTTKVTKGVYSIKSIETIFDLVRQNLTVQYRTPDNIPVGKLIVK